MKKLSLLAGLLILVVSLQDQVNSQTYNTLDKGITATTNANLTGPISSVGNATSITAQTGTGTTFVTQTSPTLITPVLGVATGTSYQGAVGNVTPSTGAFTTLTATINQNAATVLTKQWAKICD